MNLADGAVSWKGFAMPHITAQVVFVPSISGSGRLILPTLPERDHRVFAGMRDPRGRDARAATGVREAPNVEVLDLDVTSDASLEVAVQTVQNPAGTFDGWVNHSGAPYSIRCGS